MLAPLPAAELGLAWLGALAVLAGLLLAAAQRLQGQEATTVFYLLLPGLILLGYWYRTALRLRILLREGRPTGAEVLAIRSPAPPGSSGLYVHYRYHDQHGVAQEASHHLPRNSVLGQELLDGRSEVVVIHDHARTGYSRITAAADFTKPQRVTAP